MLILEKRYAHGTLATGWAYMPTQEKKKRLGILGNKEILRKSQIWVET